MSRSEFRAGGRPDESAAFHPPVLFVPRPADAPAANPRAAPRRDGQDAANGYRFASIVTMGDPDRSRTDMRA